MKRRRRKKRTVEEELREVEEGERERTLPQPQLRPQHRLPSLRDGTLRHHPHCRRR